MVTGLRHYPSEPLVHVYQIVETTLSSVQQYKTLF